MLSRNSDRKNIVKTHFFPTFSHSIGIEHIWNKPVPGGFEHRVPWQQAKADIHHISLPKSHDHQELK